LFCRETAVVWSVERTRGGEVKREGVVGIKEEVQNVFNVDGDPGNEGIE
jgi:hypothetical protein